MLLLKRNLHAHAHAHVLNLVGNRGRPALASADGRAAALAAKEAPREAADSDGPMVGASTDAEEAALQAVLKFETERRTYDKKVKTTELTSQFRKKSREEQEEVLRTAVEGLKKHRNLETVEAQERSKAITFARLMLGMPLGHLAWL